MRRTSITVDLDQPFVYFDASFVDTPWRVWVPREWDPLYVEDEDQGSDHDDFGDTFWPTIQEALGYLSVVLDARNISTPRR